MTFWMQTSTGGQFFFDPAEGVSSIDIVDIARSLSRIIRFAGHSSAPISVAEHSCVVMEIVAAEGGSDRQQLYALLHDAHEAYTGDTTRPLKEFLQARYHVDLRSFETEVQTRIYTALGIPLPEPSELASIVKADHYALAVERNRYMPSAHRWHTDGTIVPEHAEGHYGIWGDDEAMRYFEKNYDRLKAVVDFQQRLPLEKTT